MTGELRTYLRQELDAYYRHCRQLLIDAGEVSVCSSCGCEMDQRTPGCGRCGDRHRKRSLQTDPAYSTKWAAWRRQKRAEAKTV